MSASSRKSWKATGIGIRRCSAPTPHRPGTVAAQNVNDRVLYPQTRGLFNTQSRYLGNDYRLGYNALQFRIDRRFHRGLSLLASYALSKGIDDVVAPQPGLTPGVANPFNLTDYKAVATSTGVTWPP